MENLSKFELENINGGIVPGLFEGLGIALSILMAGGEIAEEFGQEVGEAIMDHASNDC